MPYMAGECDGGVGRLRVFRHTKNFLLFHSDALACFSLREKINFFGELNGNLFKIYETKRPAVAKTY
jgi:hypothetical protein